MGNPVASFEVTGADAERAQKFHAELFDWKVDADPAMGGCALVDTGDGIDPASAPGAVGVKMQPGRFAGVRRL